jgi:WD40 repeat protein
VWNVRTGAVIARLQGFKGTLKAVFSPDGSRIATVTKDAIQIWDAVRYEPLLTLYGTMHGVLTSLTFSPDGSRLLGLAAPGGIWMFSTGTAHPMLGHP